MPTGTEVEVAAQTVVSSVTVMVVAGMVWVPGWRVVGDGVGSGTTGMVTTGMGASEVVGTGTTLLLVLLMMLLVLMMMLLVSTSLVEVEVGGGLWTRGGKS